MVKKRSGSKIGVDDLVLLDQLKEDAITANLRIRYAQDIIYTNIGPVLIAVNPFKNIPANYTEARIREYRGKSYFETSPHIYALADDAYRSMTNFQENQCIIITGESGSGKTESSKIIMQYIAAVSGKSAEVQRVKERMLASNPVLEAFGNAKTVNNNNSSRFGKYMVILFDFRGDPVGGTVTNYLLEKSRVVGPSVGERNFHIFYQLCSGMTEQQREQFVIYSADYYYYLYRSNCYKVDTIDDTEEFHEMCEAMREVGFSEEEMNETFRVVSTVLWLGNVTFVEDDQEKASVADPQVLEVVAALLQVDPVHLEKALCERVLQTGFGARKEIFHKPNTQKQAENTRDTLAKAMYSKLFDFIVKRVNDSIEADDVQGTHIGVLDIYGFEIFDYNSFEQLCINFVNERLQQIFIELTLKSEQEEYRAEGIPWTDIDYFNNKPCCDLIEGKPGILSVCDDACHTSKTDVMFVNDLGNIFSGDKFIVCGNRDFTITHYAGRVRYEVEGFLEKNKDTLFDDLVEILQTSPCAFASLHGWNDIEIQRGQKKRPPTVGKTFSRQVQALMGALSACTPHYIRCIKPNQTKLPDDFDTNYTKHQVSYLGLLENVRVRRAGYASRMTFERFNDRYTLLSEYVYDNFGYASAAEMTRQILADVGFRENEAFAIGTTKVFIREAASLFQLEDLLDRKYSSAAASIQKVWKRYKTARFFLKIRADCYDVVRGQKERRANSVSREYLGDYLDFSYNPIVRGILKLSNLNEKVIFADRSRVVIVRGKKSFFKKIASAFSKPEELMASRFLMLTEQAVYSFVFEADPQTGKTRAKMYYRVPLKMISSVSLSTYQDNFMILHFSAQAGTTDSILSCKRKTEFVGLLVDALRNNFGTDLRINFTNNDSLEIKRKNKRAIVNINFVKDEACPEEKLISVKKDIEVHIASGIAPNDAPEPYRPPDIDPNAIVRDQLQALYDFEGNGIDELSFRSGEILNVIDPENDGWYRCELRGQKGFVPATYVTVLGDNEQKSFQKSLTIKDYWEKVWDEDSQDYYFYNSVTGASQWDAPRGFKE